MPESFTQPVDLSHPDLRGFNHKAAASSNTSFVRCRNCPGLQTASFQLQICCKFVHQNTSQFEHKESNLGFAAADPFLEATGDSTSVPSDDVQEDGANISCSRAQQDEVQNTMQATSRRPRNKECSSKYYGVRFRPDLSKWVAEIRVAEWKSVDKKVWLGTYISEEGAAHAVDAARKILRCNKKQKPNFSCKQLEAYAESLPPELSLKNISDNTIFKAITEFVKGKARQYASEFVSTPIPKEIRTSTPVNNNRQPGAGGDVSPSDAAAVCQLGSITTDSFELVSYLDHGVKAIEMPRDFSSELSHQQLSPFHATAVIAASDNFFDEVYGEEFVDGNAHITTPCSSMMFLPGVSLDWSQQQPVSASTGEAVVHQDSIFMSLEEGFMMLSQPEPTHWTQDQIFGLDFNTEHMPANSDMWVENYLGSCAEEPVYTDAPMEEVDPGRASNGSWDTKLVPSFTMSSQGDGINSCMDTLLEGVLSGH
ncbi:hypothetical protein BDL97_15G082200 [Sphagnum fallax]|nr:hypothetical protein BDL97_15G082200 [Sphagnum fallax]